MRDPYTVLGVGRDASDDEIKRSYRRLAKKLHPDVNPGKRNEQQFRELSAAYELLSDGDKRQRFDRGEIDADGKPRGFGAGAGPRPSGAGAEGFFSEMSIDEMFQDLLRRGRRGAAPRGEAKRPDASATTIVRVSFLEAALGGKRQVKLPEDRVIEVAIPRGIETGQKLRLRDPRAGEILLEIAVDPHPVFTRKDRDIHVEALVPLADAVLGGSITVPTIHGDVTVKVPKGANTGATLRLRGKGIEAEGAAGDQYVKLKLALPDPPDPELTAVLERWAAKSRGSKG